MTASAAHQRGLFEDGATAGAVISPCGRYRYRLWRRWDPGFSVTWLMLNPSTADAEVDDPTIRKCIGFSKRWGYSAIEVVNLFAWRATDPKDLLARWRSAHDIVGPDNDRHILSAVARSPLVVAAWGNDDAARLGGRDAAVLHGFGAECLGRTSKGAPRHPLMLAYDTALVQFRARPP